MDKALVAGADQLTSEVIELVQRLYRPAYYLNRRRGAVALATHAAWLWRAGGVTRRSEAGHAREAAERLFLWVAHGEGPEHRPGSICFGEILEALSPAFSLTLVRRLRAACAPYEFSRGFEFDAHRHVMNADEIDPDALDEI